MQTLKYKLKFFLSGFIVLNSVAYGGVSSSSVPEVASGADIFSLLKGVSGAEQESGNWCWAAVTQMMLSYHRKNHLSQCQVVSAVRGANCCDKDNLSELCLEAYSLEDSLKHYNLDLAHINQEDTLRWPVDPLEIIKELDQKQPVILRWDRGAEKSTHVNVVVGHGKRASGEKYLIVHDTSVGALEFAETDWDLYFPNVTDENYEQLPRPLAYRAWTIISTGP